jgi:ABC-2 type transport system ATP-binding protein
MTDKGDPSVVEETLEVTPMIQVSDLVVEYGSFRAVDAISFDVAPGEVVGFLGNNGAGKSTTLRTLATVAPATSGDITIAGYNFNKERDVEKARNVIGYCPDVGGVVRSATIREHINLVLSLHNKKHLWDHAMALVENFQLANEIDNPASGFSKGMTRRLSVILAALSSEKVMILDEPFDGVDPLGDETSLNLIRDAKEAGLSIVLSTHLQDVLATACDRVLVMSHGNIVDQGTSEEFSGDIGKKRYWTSLRQAQSNG